jgi:hypothetical protein
MKRCMVQLIYASAAVRPFTPLELTSLLTKAQTRNSLHGVTGLLLYSSGSFLQVLEGAEDKVDLIFASIDRDPRHSNSKILLRSRVARPEFDQWSMGFENTSASIVSIPGALNYNQALASLTLGSSDAKRYLRFFKEGLCRQVIR